MQDKIFVPERIAVYQEKIKRSLFIASLEMCNDENEAHDFLVRIISNHRDANHNCRAYIIEGREYFSDDGEPSGTGGRPILNAIKRSGLENVMVIVTRYFGGIKLGVRGLIDAYGGTAAKVLEMAGKKEKILTSRLTISFDYSSMGFITKILEDSHALNLSWEYGENISVDFEVPVNFLETLSGTLNELEARKIIREVGSRS